MTAHLTDLVDAWRDFERASGRMVRFSTGPNSILVAEPTVEAWRALAAVFTTHGYGVRSGEAIGYDEGVSIADGDKYLHAFGIALDVNWTTNPATPVETRGAVLFSRQATQALRAEDVKYGRSETDMTAAMIEDVHAIRTRTGKAVFAWGGDFSPVRLPMQFIITVTPEDLASGVAPRAATASGKSARFEQVRPLAERWLGLVAPGGTAGQPRRFGIALEDLGVWRRQRVTPEDLRALTMQEASEIYFAKYWQVIAGDDVPPSIALILYMWAVRDGGQSAVEALKTALQIQVTDLKVDSVVDLNTLDALERADLRKLIDDILKSYAQEGNAINAGLQGLKQAALELADPLDAFNSVEAEIATRQAARKSAGDERMITALELIADELSRLRAEATVIRKMLSTTPRSNS